MKFGAKIFFCSCLKIIFKNREGEQKIIIFIGKKWPHHPDARKTWFAVPLPQFPLPLRYGYEACHCEEAEDHCKTCCMYKGECTSSWLIPEMPNNTMSRGKPCNSYRGYCDALGTCQVKTIPSMYFYCLLYYKKTKSKINSLLSLIFIWLFFISVKWIKQ